MINTNFTPPTCIDLYIIYMSILFPTYFSQLIYIFINSGRIALITNKIIYIFSQYFTLMSGTLTHVFCTFPNKDGILSCSCLSCVFSALGFSSILKKTKYVYTAY